MIDAGGFMNIAPEPAAGIGMCRLVAQTDGETVRRVDPHVGFSHRGIEKLVEEKNLIQGAVLVEKLNAAAPYSCAHAFVLAAERLIGATVPKRASFIRTAMAEAGRVMSHLRAIADLAAETGTEAVRPVARRAAALIRNAADALCGGCPPAAFIRVGGVRNDWRDDYAAVWEKLLTVDLPPLLTEIEDLLTENAVFKSRTVGVGVVDAATAVARGFTGVNLRACGEKRDLRADEPYEAYAGLPFDVPLKTRGDSYARYLLRVFEIYQSMALIRKIAEILPVGETIDPEYDVAGTGLTALSRRYGFYGRGIDIPAGEVYAAVESPSGEFGVFMVGDGSPKPYRCHFRSAGFSVMQALDGLVAGADLADARVILASLDIKTTEVDR